ncbi:MAG: universal stress protein [Crocinitomicaceae bacterium]
MSTRNILVPHDFTKAADVAFTYAIALAEKLSSEVNVIHIVKDNKGVAAVNQKLEDHIATVKGNTSIVVNCMVRIGDIFTDISSAGKELHSSIIIMGTHGARGMQKVFGSFAIKIITSTHIPFIIIQEDYVPTPLEKIIVPIDISKESLQVEQVVSAIAKQAEASVNVIAENHTDTSLKIKVAVHFKVIAEQFDNVGVKYTTESIKRLAAKEIMNYTTAVNGDLVGIAYHTDSILPQFDRIFQDLLMNDQKLPVLIINAKEVGNYFF